MCLIIFRWQPDSSKPLILLGNRDEFYRRPSLTAHYWSDIPTILGGRDLEAQGTWLGLNGRKRLCTVTNFREVRAQAGTVSRGEIPVAFLKSRLSAAQFAQTLETEQHQYSGFNALLYDGEQLVYTSNRSAEPYLIISPGDYGLSNHLLDTSWPKVERAKSLFQATLEDGEANTKDLLDIMSDNWTPKDLELPNTGIGIEGERLLSPMFIESEHYGTRTSSLVIVGQDETHFIERNYVQRKPLLNQDSENAKSPKEETPGFEDQTFIVDS